MEFWLSLLKVAAIIAMIGGGLGIMVFGFGMAADQAPTGVQNLWVHGGFMPHGVSGLIASLAVGVFALGGIEIIGISAGEAKDPARGIPPALNPLPPPIPPFFVLPPVGLVG